MRFHSQLDRRGLAAVVVVGALILLGPAARPAQAGYIVTFEQVGSDVVATGSGTIDLTALSFTESVAQSAYVFASFPSELTGTGTYDVYRGSITGPGAFGSGNEFFASSQSGDAVGFEQGGEVAVPHDYVSGTLSSNATWSGQTFASLGLTPGTYAYTWGTGPDQNYTVQIGAETSVVPVPPTMVLLGSGLLGLGLARRDRFNLSRVLA